MARARILKMGFFENEVLATLPDKARLLYAGLWLIADRSGRLEDRPARIRAQVFPYEPVDCEALLTQLASAGFIRRYEYEGIKVVDLPSFLTHQSPHHREPDSKLPAFSQSLGSAEACPGLALTLPQPSPTDPVLDPVVVLVPDPVLETVRVDARAPLEGGEWRQRSRTPGLLQGPLAHERCFPSPGCGRGLCVPLFVSSEWLGQCEGDSAYLDTFIANTLRFTPAGPQGDPAKFWRAQWDAKHRTAVVSSTKPLYSVQEIRNAARTLGPDSWAAECVREHAAQCGDAKTHEKQMAVAS